MPRETRDTQRSTSSPMEPSGGGWLAHLSPEAYSDYIPAVYAYLQELGINETPLEYLPNMAHEGAHAFNPSPPTSSAAGYEEQASHPLYSWYEPALPAHDTSLAPTHLFRTPPNAYAGAIGVVDYTQPLSTHASDLALPRKVQPDGSMPDGNDVSLPSFGADTFYPDSQNVAPPGGAIADFVPPYPQFNVPNAAPDATYVGDSKDRFAEVCAALSRVPQRHNTSQDSMLPVFVPQDGQTHNHPQYFGPGRYRQEPEALAMVHVPQEEYRPHGRTIRHRSTLSIAFIIDGAGVLLRDVRNGSAALPEDWANTLPETFGFNRQKITIRLHLRGYRAQSVSLNIRNFVVDSRPISKAKLLERTAKAIEVMIKDCESYIVPDEGTFSVRKGDFDHIRLLSLRRVSTGSWQPELCMPVRASA